MLLSHSHHGWNSFESIAEIYNESMRDSQNHNYINMVDFSRSYPITLEEGNYVLHTLYYAFSTLHTVRMCLIIHYSIYVLYTIYIPWARVLCLIYKHKPEGKCVYIRQSTSARIPYILG